VNINCLNISSENGFEPQKFNSYSNISSTSSDGSTYIDYIYKYCGKERDEETGLYYYGARYYAAWLCRFVSVDPLNEKYPELSAYQYASNRPITMIDLDGLEAFPNPFDQVIQGVKGMWDEAMNYMGLTPAKELNNQKALEKQQSNYNKQGYTVAINNKTQDISIFKSELALSKDKVSTRTSMNYELTESVFQINPSGNIADIYIRKTGIIETYDKSGKLTNISKTELGYEYSTPDNIDNMKAQYTDNDPIVQGLSYLNNPDDGNFYNINREKLFSQDFGLPGISNWDIFESNSVNLFRFLAILVKKETLGVENYVKPDISNTTILNIDLKNADKAKESFEKLSKQLPVREM